ncbi:unnamed protein product [Vitrella brassicaformis CCMP3155]|uniref:Pacifastin domain-containing protein n=1 Tax=Vitrella brassicaformis (strain CCMP3155) TaxID=1169540 RepID=A0A0G4EPC7_VITBC|nr:unnamed protein product [Vitrella brassicaformis CCMP3155]|eukprot:CEL99306.1 unnamed protein product [Vitrella brassicaformis CCMP3155]
MMVRVLGLVVLVALAGVASCDFVRKLGEKPADEPAPAQCTKPAFSTPFADFKKLNINDIFVAGPNSVVNATLPASKMKKKEKGGDKPMKRCAAHSRGDELATQEAYLLEEVCTDCWCYSVGVIEICGYACLELWDDGEVFIAVYDC